MDVSVPAFRNIRTERVIKKAVDKMLKKIGKERVRRTLIQFIKFGMVGISNTAINYLVYAICLRIHWHWFPSSVAGFVVSVLNAYYWNNKFVFKTQTENRIWWRSLLRTYIAYGTTGLLLSNVLLFLWLEIIHIEQYLGEICRTLQNIGFPFGNTRSFAEYIAPVFSFVITIPLNFFLNKYWAYREKK